MNIMISYQDLFSKNLNIVKRAIDKYEKSWNEMCDLREQKITQKDRI